MPPLNAGVADVIAMQVEKLSEDNCMLPLHVVFVCPVTVPVLIASLKVTATVVPMATPEAELAGVVLLIVGGVVSTTHV